MQRSKLPVLAGVLFFFILGLVALYVYLQPGKGRGRESAQNDVAREDDNRETRKRGGESDTPPANGPEKPTDSGKPEGPVLPKAEIVTGKITGVVVDSEDSPLPGTSVLLLGEKGSGTSGPSAACNEKGVFSFETSLESEAQYFVACISDEWAIAATDAFAITPEKPVIEGLKLKLLRPARLRGEVISGDDKKPLEGVEIKMSAPRMTPREDRIAGLLGRFAPVKSDAGGKYEVGRIPPGNYSVKAVKKGWIANEFNPLTRDTQNAELAEYANLELLPFILIEAGIVEGRVVRKSDKKPIVGANVELTSTFGGNFGVQVTDTEGKYRFENAPPSGFGGNRAGRRAAREVPGGPPGMGGLEVRALAEGFAINSVNVNVVAAETTQAPDLELEDGCTVSGRVVDQKGAGISGAAVYFNNNQVLQGGEMVVGLGLPKRAVSTTSDVDGAFTLNYLPPSGERNRPRIICASAKGYCNGEAATQLVPGTPTANVLITLSPAGVIAGRVTDENNEPIAGIPIAAYEAGGPQQLGDIMKAFFGEELPDRGSNSIVPPSIRSGEDGSYRIEGLKAKKYIVIANSRRHEKHVSKEIDVKSGETVEYNIKLVNGGAVFGRVYDAQNKPVNGAAITAARMGEDGVQVRTTYSDTSGSYEISGLSEGTYTVRRFDGDFIAFGIPNPATSVVVKRGERTRFDIYEQRPGTARIYGRVRVDGQAYVSKGLFLYGQGRKGTAVNQTTTDEQGDYEFRSVPLGTYQIAQRAEGGFPIPNLVRKTVYVDKAGDIEVNLDFVTVTISGTVTLDGGGVPEGQVRVWVNPVNAQNEDGSPKETDQQISPIEEIVATRAECDKKTGAFEIKGLSPGAYKITVRSDKYGMLIRPYLNASASVAGLQLVLPRENTTLHGIVKGLENAKPTMMGRIIAVVTIEDAKGAQVTLGENGVADLTDKKEFDIKNLPPGTYSVVLSITNYAPCRVKNVVFEAGAIVNVSFEVISSGSAKIIVSNKDLNLDQAYQLTYEIRDSQNQIYKKPFTFLDFFAPDGSMNQNPDENSFTIKDLPQDTYTITFKHPEYEDCKATFTVVTGQTIDVPVTFKKK